VRPSNSDQGSAFDKSSCCKWDLGLFFALDFFFYKLNYLQPWVIAGGFFMFQNTVTLYGWIGIPISSYQSYLKIERGLSKNTVQNYSFDIERLCLSNNKWNWSFSDSNQWETVQQFIFHSQWGKCTFAGENNIRTKSFFGYLIFEDYRLDNPLELIESPKRKKLPDILSVDEIDSYCIHRLDFKRGRT
jgi:hypothetical protein